MEPEEQQPSAAIAGQPIEWAASGSFVELLDRLGFSLVVSTRPNHVIFIGASDGRLNVNASLMAHPMGLAVDAHRMAVSSTRTITIFSNVARLAPHYPGRPDFYDAFFVPRTLYFTGDCHMHDLQLEGAAVIGANTNFSCICRVDGNFSFTPLWMPPFISQLRAEDRCHLNGFCGYQGQLYYVTALAQTDAPAGWRDLPDEAGVLIDAQRGAILRDDLCMPHSPRLIRNELYVLNGGEGEVLRIDRATGRHTVVASLPGFTHGLCAYGNVLFVGLSQNRISRKQNPPSIAQRRESLVAGVAAVESRSGAIMGMLEFKSGVTEVYDVQQLPGVRRAGMQNILATDGFVAVETPSTVLWTKRPDNDQGHMAQVAASGNYRLNMNVKPKNRD